MNSLFLGFTVNPLERPPVVLVSRVKSSDKKEASGKEAYKRVKTWPISELRTVDGRSTDGPEFELQFERQVYKWVASSVAEKKNFITAIYKVLMGVHVCMNEVIDSLVLYINYRPSISIWITRELYFKMWMKNA